MKKTLTLALVFSLLIISSCTKAPEITKEKATIACAMLPNSALVAVAVSKGYFAEEGLDVRILPYSFGGQAIKTLFNGEADFATSADTPIVFAIMGGNKVYPVATIQTSTKNEAIFAKKEKGIINPGDIKGKRVGFTPGTNGEFFLNSFLLANNLSDTDIAPVPINPEDMLDALTKDKIDAVASWQPYLYNFGKAFGDKGISFYDDRIFTEIFNISTSQSVIQKEPEKIKKLIKALIKAEEFSTQNPEKSIEITAEFIKMDQVVLSKIWNNFEYRVTLGQMVVLAMENIHRWREEQKDTLSTSMPNYMDYVYDEALRSVKPNAVSLFK